MNILCINTAFEQTYVALQCENKIYTKSMDSSLKQSENILGAVDECLNNAKIQISNLDVISCVIGPGSFTGIRIGASLVKGFCMACPNIKKIEVNSLDLVAYIYSNQNELKNDFYVALNGLSGNIFACKYNNLGYRVSNPELLTSVEFSGDIVGLKEENFDICNHVVSFDCSSLLNYSLKKANNNEYSLDFVPLYLRKSQAEAELDKKNENR